MATTKQQLVTALAKAAEITKVQAAFYYDVFVDEMVKRLERQQEVVLKGIGRFGFVKTNIMKSNLTGQLIPPHKRLHFYPVTQLAQRIRKLTKECSGE